MSGWLIAQGSPLSVPVDHYRFSDLSSLLRSVEQSLDGNGRKRKGSRKSSKGSPRATKTRLIATTLMASYVEDHKNLRQRISANLDVLILPLIALLRSTQLTEAQLHLLDTLEFNLRQVVSGFGMTVTEANPRLSSREAQICNMIRQGKDTKQIAQDLGVSYFTVITQRKAIRKKLGLCNRKQNLARYVSRNP